MSVLTSLLTGLGLFFCGVSFIAANLAPLAGPAARRLFRRAVSTSWGAATAGFAAGLATQSTSAVTLAVVGFVRAGILPERRAALLPVWAQVGAALLVILVTLQTSALVAYALVFAGAVLYFDLNLSERVRHAVLVLLGVGLLFLGAELLTQASDPLRAWMAGHGLLSRHESRLLLILVGLVLAALTQSSTTTGAIAVAVVRAGIFDLGSALLLLVGASVGSAINYGLPGWRGEAVGRHILFFQTTQKLAGAGLLTLLLVLTSGHPESMLAVRPANEATVFALVFLIVQVGGSLICTLLRRPLSDLFQALSPPAEDQALGRPAYLLDEALADPMLALDLVEREEERLLQRLPMMLDGVRADGAVGAPSTETLREAGLEVGEAIRRYLAGVLESEPGRQAVVRAMRLQHVLDNVVALHEAVAEFQRAVQAAQAQAAKPVGRVVESLHLLLQVVVDVAISRDPAEQEVSLALLGDRRQVIEGLRGRLMGASGDARVQEALFRSTVLFERILWLARDTAVTVMRVSGEARANPAVQPPPALAPGEA